MPGEPPAKRRQLPFKPPSRTSGDNASAGPSSAPKGKGKSVTKASAREPPSVVAGSSKPTKPARSAATSSSEYRRISTSNALPSTPSDFDSDSDSDEAVNPTRERPLSEEPDYILAEIISKKPDRDVVSDKPVIPPQLITRLLHHHFKNEKTRIAKDADAVVAKYVDTFVREAIARAALESRTNEKKGNRRVDGFLEVCLCFCSFCYIMFIPVTISSSWLISLG